MKSTFITGRSGHSMSLISKRFLQFFTSILGALALMTIFSTPASAAECTYVNDVVGYACHAEPQPSTFLDPQEFKESFLQRTTYARVADLTNVYPSPSLGTAPVRNLGDGYLWVTVMGRLESEGSVWYQINPGEYVHGDDLSLGEISEFVGVEISVQPTRPFGWMVADGVRPSTSPGVEPDQTFNRMSRYTFVQIFDSVMDDEGWLWYDIGGGRWMKQTYMSLVSITPRPADVGPNDLWVQVDLYEQSLAAYEGDRMVFATLISSGLNRWPTNEGLFQVWSRHVATKMSGAEGKVDYYFIEDVPHTMFFDYDIALHGAYWHDRFGYKHSHGCVNLPPRASEWVFNWSNDSEEALWVHVVTTSPIDYFVHFNDGLVETVDGEVYPVESTSDGEDSGALDVIGDRMAFLLELRSTVNWETGS